MTPQKYIDEVLRIKARQETQACGYDHLTLIRDLANGKKASLTDIEITLTNIAFVLSEPMRDGDVAKAREWTIDAMSKIKEMKDE